MYVYIYILKYWFKMLKKKKKRGRNSTSNSRSIAHELGLTAIEYCLFALVLWFRTNGHIRTKKWERLCRSTYPYCSIWWRRDHRRFGAAFQLLNTRIFLRASVLLLGRNTSPYAWVKRQSTYRTHVAGHGHTSLLFIL